MNNFTVEKIDSNTFAFFDKDEDTFYLLNEKNVSILIDTGMQKGEKILPFLKKYTDKPITLFITHAHEDHLYHMDEFDTAYMSHKEFPLKNLSIDLITGGKETVDIDKTIDIKDKDTFTFNDETIKVCEVKGHTPGSVVYYAQKRKMLFTGDAIGSGCGMWLQLPGVLSLEEYTKGLDNLLNFLKDKKDNLKIFGGHQHQIYKSRLIKECNPLTYSYIQELSTLTNKVVNKETTNFIDEGYYKYKPNVKRLYCSYGKAELQFRSDKIYKENK